MAIIKQDGVEKRLKELERTVLFGRPEAVKEAYRQGFRDCASELLGEVDNKLVTLETNLELMQAEIDSVKTDVNLLKIEKVK